MKNQIALSFAALALSLVAIKSFTPVLAYQGDASVKGPNYTEERHQINVKAFEKGDYNAWATNMSGRGVTRSVNESNFKEFVTAQIASQKGDSTLLNAFRVKYNIGQGNRQGNGTGMHNNH